MIPLALTLESLGFTRYGSNRSLFSTPPSEELDVNYKNKLAILRPRFAYTVTKKGNRDLKDFYMKVLDKWLAGADVFNKLDLEYLHLFIESLIAYHRVYAKK